MALTFTLMLVAATNAVSTIATDFKTMLFFISSLQGFWIAFHFYLHNISIGAFLFFLIQKKIKKK